MTFLLSGAKVADLFEMTKKKEHTFCASVQNSLFLYTFSQNCLAVSLFFHTFAPANEKIHRGVEQLVARQAHNLEVVGSSPTSATHHSRRKQFNNASFFYSLWGDSSFLVFLFGSFYL